MASPARRALLAALALFASPATIAEPDPAEVALLDAAAKGDAVRVVQALAEAAADTRDARGRTALMLAAEAGDFESARRLLWAGAGANLRDPEGRQAVDFLDPLGESFAPLSLILRCHTFCVEYVRVFLIRRPRIPHMVLVNDNWIDPFHPLIAPRYQTNLTEMAGRPGVDDDGNGFVDDVFGWNLMNDEPLRAPQLYIDERPETREFLARLMEEFHAATRGGDARTRNLMSGRYHNPLVRQIGFSNLIGAKIDLNDFVYAEMFDSASHGTHVAGIVVRHSGGRASVGGAAIGSMTPVENRFFGDIEELVRLARAAEDYGDFVSAVIDRYRREAVAKGSRASDYVRASGAGIMNMSWMRSRQFFEGIARDLEELYRIHGGNEASIANPRDPAAARMAANLPLELAVADAAAFALTFYENPFVLFVIAAGNDAEDNDLVLPTPPYLSRFFPNVITVASVDDRGNPSRFTNRGVRSVQLAARGENIVSSMLGKLEGPMSGTSMAAPMVAAAAAAIRAEHPQILASDLRRILEASATRRESLEGVVSTAGELDAEAAMAMAASWNRDNLALLLDETRRAILPGPDGPALALGTPAVNQPGAPAADQVPRITSVTGRGERWRLALSRGSGLGEQIHFGVGPWPGEGVDQAWSRGFRISSIAGAGDTWNIVMSQGVAGTQTVIGYELDPTLIAELSGQGYRISHLAGHRERWLAVLSTETGWGEQRFTLPGPLTEARRRWITEHWAEGYRITAVAGDDDPSDPDDGWRFVMSRGTDYSDQVFAGPGPWPAEWIVARLAEGFRVTHLAGGGERSIVVMSRGSGLADGEISPEGAFPTEWLQGR